MPPVLSLVFDIVRDPQFPASGASFALLQLAHDRAVKECAVHTHLYAATPAPQILEPVYTAEMLSDLVRRRA